MKGPVGGLPEIVMVPAKEVPCRAGHIVPDRAYEENCFLRWAEKGADKQCESRETVVKMRPRIALAQAGRSWPWELLVFVTCRVSCRQVQRKGGRCREIGGRVGAECAPFEGGWRTLRTHRPDPAVTPEMQRWLGGKRWEKLSQRIMSGELEALRVCQLSHYICRDCIRSYVLVSNGEIGGCPILWENVV